MLYCNATDKAGGFMYGKIFDSIYDGTLAEDWRALITFQQLIVLCDADGMVDMTPQSISRRTGIPIEHIISGIEVLEKNDKYSRTPTENGKRIELIDDHRNWGWHIINHEKYKNMRDADTIRAQTRERVRKHREKKRSVTQGNDSKRHIDKEIDTNTNTKIKTSGFQPPSQKEVEQYCIEKTYSIDAESFICFYESKGWMVGKNKMKNWKASLTNWQKRGNNNGQQTTTSRAKQHQDKLREIAERDIEQNGHTDFVG